MASEKHRQRPGEGSQERTVKKVLSSWSILIFSVVCGISLAFHNHYKVPLPSNHDGFNKETGLSDFSEHNAMNIISHLSDTIGYRKFNARECQNLLIVLTYE